MTTDLAASLSVHSDPIASASASVMLAPYADAVEDAFAAAAGRDLDLADFGLVVLTRAFPSYIDDVGVLVELAVETVAEKLWCEPAAALPVAVRPLDGEQGDVAWVPRDILVHFLAQSPAYAPLLPRVRDAGARVPILLLGVDLAVFHVELRMVE